MQGRNRDARQLFHLHLSAVLFQVVTGPLISLLVLGSSSAGQSSDVACLHVHQASSLWYFTGTPSPFRFHSQTPSVVLSLYLLVLLGRDGGWWLDPSSNLCFYVTVSGLSRCPFDLQKPASELQS